MTKKEQSMRLYQAVERLALQAGEDTDETIDWLCGEHGGMAKLFKKYFSQTPPAAQPAPVQEPVAICPNCLGTKRPHADDPDWRGRCDCTPPAAPVQVPVAEVAGSAHAMHIKFLPAGISLQPGDKLYTTPPAAQPAAPAIPSGWSLTPLDSQHFKLKSPEGRWWDFGPDTDGPDRLVWEFLSAMRDGVPLQKGGEA